jgi:hypothetical protein
VRTCALALSAPAIRNEHVELAGHRRSGPSALTTGLGRSLHSHSATSRPRRRVVPSRGKECRLPFAGSLTGCLKRYRAAPVWRGTRAAPTRRDSAWPPWAGRRQGFLVTCSAAQWLHRPI